MRSRSCSSIFDKLIWCIIGPKSFLFGTAQFSLWTSGTFIMIILSLTALTQDVFRMSHTLTIVGANLARASKHIKNSVLHIRILGFYIKIIICRKVSILLVDVWFYRILVLTKMHAAHILWPNLYICVECVLHICGKVDKHIIQFLLSNTHSAHLYNHPVHVLYMQPACVQLWKQYMCSMYATSSRYIMWGWL